MCIQALDIVSDMGNDVKMDGKTNEILLPALQTNVYKGIMPPSSYL